LHHHGTPQGRDAEREADAFASAFLMPSASVIAHAVRNPSLLSLIKLKAIWMVSVAALNRRLVGVGMTSDWQYRTLCIEIAKRGFRTREPREVPRAELEQLMFGLTMTSIEGGRKKAGASAKAKLELIK
jgi:Zn-dependent peptidase ImmA (M78 family)